ncbi:alpha/beta hydrolase [Hyphomonas sp.]|uniref:alpha/beta hydrolase n=1 Tax=Hyphomonas sp. TaxID=87 RepID=UPI0030F9B86C
MDIGIDQINAMLRASSVAGDANATVEERRAGMLATTAVMTALETVEISEATLGGRPALAFRSPSAVAGKALLYLHGGGYVIGSPETHRGIVSHICDAMGANAWSLDYRMGPEDRYPAGVDDAVAAYRELLETHTPGDVIIAGDSAGGGLALASAMKARDAGLRMPAGLVLLSPWTNLNQVGSSYDTKAEADLMVSREALNWYVDQYLGADGNTDDPYVSPACGDFTGMPPMLVQVGTAEMLYSDSVAVAERAGAANIAVTLECWPHMPHVFQAFYPFLADSRAAIARIGAWGAAQLNR